MREFFQAENIPVVRTDFSDDAAWNSLCREIAQPSDPYGFVAVVDFVSDPRHDGLGPDRLRDRVPPDSFLGFFFVVDAVTLGRPDHPILVVGQRSGRTFRVIPSAMWIVENNMSMGSMKLGELADAADDDGVFRGEDGAHAKRVAAAAVPAPELAQPGDPSPRQFPVRSPFRMTVIPVHNNQQLEVFVRTRDGFYSGHEVWMVGVCKGERTIIDHFQTHRSLEGGLVYARAGDLIWSDAEPSMLPTAKHRKALEMEKTIARGTFLDLDNLSDFVKVTTFLTPDRKACNAAKRAILGRWTDGIATITFEPESRLQVTCPDAPSHPLCAAVHHLTDGWKFVPWRLGLFYKGILRVQTGVLRCDDRELHIMSRQRDIIAHVFHRDDTA